MDLIHFKNQFEKRNLNFLLHNGADDDLINFYEKKLNVKFPIIIKAFYIFANGYSVNTPSIEHYSLDKLDYFNKEILQFMIVDNKHMIGWKIDKQNSADQWDIINCASKEIITLTLPSLWSNKIWKWIDHKKAFWDGVG